MTELELCNKELSDLSHFNFAWFTKLTRLDLNGNQIRDVSPVASLTNLTR